VKATQRGVIQQLRHDVALGGARRVRQLEVDQQSMAILHQRLKTFGK
jgi:hypothetical protein